MASSDGRVAPSVFPETALEPRPKVQDPFSQAGVSTALVTVFRGKFRDAVLPNRNTVTFEKEEVIYEVGDREQKLFFLQDGFVEVGTITLNGRE